MNSKAFFNRKGGFFLNGTRNTLVACEVQDNWWVGFRVLKNYATMTGCIADSNQVAGFLLGSTNGYLGGLNLNGITAVGRNENQKGKPWKGQAVGINFHNTTFNGCLFTGVTRDNNLNIRETNSHFLEQSIRQIVEGRTLTP